LFAKLLRYILIEGSFNTIGREEYDGVKRDGEGQFNC
jgi:hypothetical protein